jgi:hypothetical protein
MPHAHRTLDLSATCDCGAVTLAVNGAVAAMFQCACSNCQKVSGSGHSSVVLLPSAAVTVAGETVPFSRPAASGATFTRHFCPRCATTVWAQSSRAAGLSIIPVGLFAGENDWFAPSQLIFAESHQAWDLIDAHIPRHDRYRGNAS